MAACLCALPAAALAKPSFTDVPPHAIAIEARSLPSFDRSRPDKTRFGALEWRGGLHLSAASSLFGGWSGLALDSGGERLLAVSDAGLWLEARIRYENGRPAGLDDARIGALKQKDGAPLANSRTRDAESVTPAGPDGLGDAVYIAFERVHRIGLFPLSDRGIGAPSQYLPLPEPIRRAERDNFGIEALSVLRAGRYKGALVAFAERRRDGDGHHLGWLFEPSGPRPLALTSIRDFDLTGLAALEDGGLLVLERRFRWTEGLHIRIRHIGRDEIAPGATMSGEILMEASLAFHIDNMEGIAVHPGERDEVIVTLISDNNYNLFQRSLLLQFAWPRQAAPESGRPPQR